MTQDIPIQEMRAFVAGSTSGELTGWTLGRIEGERAGYRRAVADCQQQIRTLVEDACVEYQGHVNKAVVDLVLKRGSYQLAAERRNQPERAARQRQILAERGL